MNSKNILVVDASPLFRKALCDLAELAVDNATVYDTSSGLSAMNHIRDNNVDLVILDIELETSSGFDLVRRLRGRGFEGKILFVAENDYPFYSHTAKSIGANGYISKSDSIDQIKESVSAIMRGYSVFKDLPTNGQTLVELSSRESVVYSYLIKGYSNKKISELLSLSSKTVSTYKARILEKYNVDSIIEIMNFQKLAS